MKRRQVDKGQNMCNSKAKSLVTYHYGHGTSGSATVALSSTPRLSSFPILNSLQLLLLFILPSSCAIALFLSLLSAASSPRASSPHSGQLTDVESRLDLPFGQSFSTIMTTLMVLTYECTAL
ncbi:hypothetical protein N7537_011233 [Penicillium hordei]|uniref:Uncharacterized protein n=1 Tax=Penicillium hordei TaxID=40994 RepID=A0AAD6GTU2_9EURO|nr:uncharacterized protein N7537_011233 [Penicillium hordei]KAJ5588555.1 hypothetical protein N7537_011233 [Penicillium hordei]